MKRILTVLAAVVMAGCTVGSYDVEEESVGTQPEAFAVLNPSVGVPGGLGAVKLKGDLVIESIVGEGDHNKATVKNIGLVKVPASKLHARWGCVRGVVGCREHYDYLVDIPALGPDETVAVAVPCAKIVGMINAYDVDYDEEVDEAREDNNWMASGGCGE